MIGQEKIYLTMFVWPCLGINPERNIIDMVPDYYIHETDDWLVFPHEMDGLTEEEIFTNKKNMKEILSQVTSK